MPATACLAITLVAIGGNLSPAGLGQAASANLILSNQDYSAYASGGSQNVQNHLDSLTFDWTNRSASTTSMGFTPSTN